MVLSFPHTGEILGQVSISDRHVAAGFMIPVAVTQPDWKVLDSYLKEETGYQLESGIELHGLKKTDPCAFIAATQLFQNHLKVIRHSYGAMSHVSMTFCHYFDDAVERDNLYKLDSLDITSTKVDKGYLVFMSGTMRQWRSAIVMAQSHGGNIKKLMNIVHSYFEQTLLREMFHGFEKNFAPDGSYTIR